MVLDAALLNTQPYKVRVKDEVEQSRERSSALPYTSVVVAIQKGAFGSPSTKVTNFTMYDNITIAKLKKLLVYQFIS